MNIGAVFSNISENGNSYMSVVLNEEIKELFPALKNLRITLKEIDESERKENSPYYRVELYKPKTKED
jgi:uncharacterized protein (DUF736 family)